MAGLSKRKGTYHLRMRVPRRYDPLWVGVEKPPKEIHRSLKTGDKSVALQRLPSVEAHVIAELDARLAGRDAPGSISHYEAIAKIAAAHGFGYRTAQQLGGGELNDILRRAEALVVGGEKPGGDAAAALLGGVERPSETLMGVAERMHEICALEVKHKEGKQLRVWRDRWLRPAKKVRELLGHDPQLDKISRTDAIAFRDALKDRIIEGDMLGRSAQTELQNLNKLWRIYHQHLGYDSIEMPPCPFRELTEGMSKMDPDNRKHEVPLEFVEEIVRPGAMDHMNDEEADITLVLAETGCRQSEVTDLPPGSIFLDAPIPFVRIKNETGKFAREIKNKHSERDVPLVGIALEAMRRHPEGFPRYRNTGTYSAAANKALRKILPDGVTIGGLRHSFETRLKNAGVDSDDRAELMGHSVKRARGREWYGDSMPLEVRQEHIEKIAVKPQRALPAPG